MWMWPFHKAVRTAAEEGGNNVCNTSWQVSLQWPTASFLHSSIKYTIPQIKTLR